MLLKRNLKTPPRSSFGILRPPIFHPKKIEGPPTSPPPPFNLNYDWSLTVTAILIFKCTEGAGVGANSSRWGGRGGEKNKVTVTIIIILNKLVILK